MAENWTIKSAEPKEDVSVQEAEQAVVEEAIANTPNVEIPQDDGVYKVNLDEPLIPTEDAVQEQQTEEVPVQPEAEGSEAVSETPDSESPEEVEAPLELIAEEETPLEKDEEANIDQGRVEQQHETAAPPPQQEEVPQVQLPENVEKLIQFMDETGGTVEDYVALNRDVSQLDNISLLREYYKKSKPFLSDDQITRQLNKKFFYDEDADPDEIEDKKIAFQEELFKAQKSFEDNKKKYYADLKLNKQNSIDPEYQQAYEGWNNYQQQLQQSQQLEQDFKAKTANVFNDEFKGFEYKVGENKYRYKVNDRDKVRDFQSDITNFVQQFLGEDGSVADAAGYHKALFAAQNADKLANHFYEQGRADAIKEAAKEAKNIDMSPRQDASAIVTPSGQKFRVVSGDSSNKLRIKMKQ